MADEIDRNVSLSSEARCQQRGKAATEAIAGFDSSRTLVRAREAVERVATERNLNAYLSPEMAKDTDVMLRAMKKTEKGWQRAVDKIAERSCQTASSTIDLSWRSVHL